MEYLSVVFLVAIGILVINYLWRNFNFFKRHDVIHIPPTSIFGILASFVFRQTSFVDIIRKMYNFNRDAKYIGLYAMTSPVLLLRDPELIKSVLVKNFDAFHDRPVFTDFHKNLITQNMFALKGNKWRDIRRLLNPSFTSGKMKIMFTLMSKYAANFAKFMSTLPMDKTDVNMKDIFEKCMNDIIVSCFFGIEIDSIREPTNGFNIYSKKLTHISVICSIKLIFNRIFPKLGRILYVRLLHDEETKYFETSIENEVTTRDTEHITRPDMIQLIMDNRGKENKIQLDMKDIIAQAYAFYFGGFETTSSVLSYITHNIAANPSIQIKLQQEINKVLDEKNGNVTYDTVSQLEYLQAVIKEGLRFFSSSVLERICTSPFELPSALPGKKPFIVNKGMLIWIPSFAIHHDEKYYDNPEEFRPERFLSSNHNNSLYLSFGLGPRSCIGYRFGMLMLKVVLFHLLARCKLQHSAKTPQKTIRFSKKHLTMMPEDGFWLNIQSRDDIKDKHILNTHLKA